MSPKTRPMQRIESGDHIYGQNKCSASSSLPKEISLMEDSSFTSGQSTSDSSQFSKRTVPINSPCSVEEAEEECFTNLIVTFLPQSVTEEMLNEIFGDIGPLLSCRVIRDGDGRPKGYGFIDYRSAEHAKQACEELNGMMLLGKRLKVSKARPRSDLIVNANLHVAGLPASWDVEELKELFSRFGEIISCKILRDPLAGQAKGIGFVRFDLRSQAEEAQRAMDQYHITGEMRPLSVNFAHTGAGSPRDRQHSKSSHESGEEHLSGSSEKYIEPNNTENWTSLGQQVPMNFSPGRQFQTGSYYTGVPAYGVFDQSYNPHAVPWMQPYLGHQNVGEMSSSDCIYPVAQMVSQQATVPLSSGGNTDLKHLSADRAPWALHIGNLPESISEGMLYNLFSYYGAVRSVKILRHRKNGSNFAFVNMDHAQEAEAAKTGLDGTMIQGRFIRVTFKKHLTLRAR